MIDNLPMDKDMNSNSKNGVILSFIIPVLNEERNLNIVFDSINNNLKPGSYEIIVVDNGSTDRSVDIAKEKGAKIIFKPGVTISEMRNTGVDNMQGEVVVFLDGDVYLDSSWGMRIKEVIKMIRKDKMILTGSQYGIRPDASWIEKYWCNPELRKKEPAYINGGHIVLRKELHKIIGGFDTLMETGEDVDYCRRAIGKGVRIFHDKDLKAIHLGYPQKLSQFIGRERWHGRGDYISLRHILNSYPALLAISQLFVMIICILCSLLLNNIWYIFIYFAYMAIISTLSSYLRVGLKKSLIYSILLYAVYYLGRTLSLYDALIIKMKNYGSSRTVSSSTG
jgi:glycosyltransferase involved in cell wall biosynthesis